MKHLDDEIVRLLTLFKLSRSQEPDDRNTAMELLDLEKPINIAVRFKGSLDSIVSSGFEPASTKGQISYGICKTKNLEKLVANENVEVIEKLKKSYLGLDHSVPDIKANQVWSRSGDDFHGYTGKGVIVGIIDTGIDFRHEAFRKADSGKTSRILKIWDQTLTPGTGESSPPNVPSNTIGPRTLGYGVEYNILQINRTLDNSAPSVRHQDEAGHGTHCAGIAAGNGMQGGNCHGGYTYIGVAPEADIIMVRLFGLSDSDSSKAAPSSSNYTIDAISYILNEAKTAGKACVISCSFGAFNDKIDGSTSQCLDIDNLLTNNSTANSIVFLAHNYADKNFHAEGTVPSGGTMPIKFKIKGGDTKTRYLAIAYTGSNLQAKVTTPVTTNNTVGWTSVAMGSSSNMSANGPNSLVSISNSANRILVTITPPNKGKNVSNKDWLLELKDSGATATPFFAYMNGSSYRDDTNPIFLDHVSPQHTICEQASCKEVVTVGSFAVSSGDLAADSGRGTTLDSPTRPKPEITAPGVGIVSAGIRSDRACEGCCCDCCHDYYVNKSGTSMATPHVAGAIALILEKNDTLTHTQIRNALTSPGNIRPRPGDANPDDIAGWGAGKLDIKAVMDSIAQVHPPTIRVETNSLAGNIPDYFTQFREQILKSDRGKKINLLFHKHLEEIRHLVNTNKKVATTWHRNRGPAWFRVGLKSVSTPDAKLPDEVDGIALTNGIEAMSHILRRFGTEELAKDLNEIQTELKKIKDGMTIHQLVELVTGETLAPQTV